MTINWDWDNQDEARTFFIMNQIASALYFFQCSAQCLSAASKKSFKDRIKSMVDEIIVIETEENDETSN